MESFILYNQTHLAPFLKQREGETKFGENLLFVNSFEAIKDTEASYVIFGIPEDIGVRANYGKPGTAKAWKAFLSSFVNIQENEHNQGSNCVLLGEVNCKELLSKAEGITSEEQLGSLVVVIDTYVTKVVSEIVSARKIPIIIGGGHNNAFGNIQGVAFALQQPIDVVNIDTHTDLRYADYRHSGNGFTYAKEKGSLRRYSMVGLHKNYTPNYVFNQMEADKNIDYTLFEDYLHLTTIDKLIKFKKATDFVKNQFGLEIDCDAIENFNSSAMSPSGFSVNEIRSFIKLAKKQKVHYLHLCEAAPAKNAVIGKALSYFVSDFIRSNAD